MWDSDQKSEDLAVDGYRISNMGFDRGTAFGLPPAFSGKRYFEIVVEENRGSFFIGWALLRAERPDFKNISIGEYDDTWGIDSFRAAKGHANKWTSYGERKLKAGDVVGCFIDLEERTMSFSINGEHLGVAFTDIPVGAYIPAVTLNYRKTSVTGNFGRQRFIHAPPSGFLALSRVTKSQFIKDAFDPTRPSFFSKLSPEVIYHIFSYLDFTDLFVCQEVCKEWRNIAQDPALWSVFERKIFKIGAVTKYNLKHTLNVCDLSAAPPNQLVSLGCDYKIKYWDLNKRQLLHSFDEKTDRTFVAFNGTDRIISASNAPSQGRINRNEVRIWDVNEGAVLFSLTGNNGGVSSFASNQTCILFRVVYAAAACKKKVTVYTYDGSVVHVFKHDKTILQVALQRNHLLCATKYTLYCWDLETADCKELHIAGEVTRIALHPSCEFAAAATNEFVCIWRLQDEKVVYCEEVESPATALRFDPVLSILYVGFEDGCQSGKQITELSEVFRAHSSPVGGLEMDERVVFSYERNRSCACLWDRKSGKLLRRFEHHAPVSHIRLLGHRVVIVYSNVISVFEFRYDFTEALQRLKQSYLEMCAAYLATFKP